MARHISRRKFLATLGAAAAAWPLAARAQQPGPAVLAAEKDLIPFVTGRSQQAIEDLPRRRIQLGAGLQKRGRPPRAVRHFQRVRHPSDDVH